MNARIRPDWLPLALAFVGAAIVTGPQTTMAEASSAPGFVIRDVTLISPERSAPLPHAYVRIDGGRIAEVSRTPLSGPRQIDGRGRFLIPGLIDTHTHPGAIPGMIGGQRDANPAIRDAAIAQAPRSYLYSGFTTVLWLGAEASDVKRWNALAERPDGYFCGKTPLVGGYSFESFERNPYFLFNPAQAERIPAAISRAEHTPEAVVARMAADGAICVKAYYEPGFGADRDRLPVPDAQTMRRLVAAAHKRGMPVFVHANSTRAQAFALETGVDVIAHGNFDAGLAPAGKLPTEIGAQVAQMVARRVGYQPTMQVVRGQVEMQDPGYLSDPALKHVYPPALLAWYATPDGQWFARELKGVRIRDDILRASVAALARDNGRLLFGTDTPAMPTYTNPPGLNGLKEMRLWIAAGVTPRQLFRALTIENARAMKVDRRLGTLEAGKVANMLLLKADPLKSVEAYDAIETVFLSGRPIARESLSAQNPKRP